MKSLLKHENSDSNRPLVSVIIPTMFRDPQEFNRAFNSVLNQTYDNIEIIVIYGGKNVQHARNIGIYKSRGKYVAFLDDDDEFAPTKIEEQVRILEAFPQVPLCICWGKDYRFGYRVYKPKEWWNFDDLLKGFNITCTSAFMVRKSVFEKTGYMDEKLQDSHEYDLALRCAELFPIYCVQKDLVTFHRSSDGNWTDRYDWKITGMLQFIKKYGHCFTLRRWFTTILCLVLFVTGFVFDKPVRKCFELAKEKVEQDGVN